MTTKSALQAAEPQPAAPSAVPAAPASAPARWRREQRTLGNARVAAAHEEAEARLHFDAEAAAMARRQGAKAFTRGRDVYFGQGRFAPETHEGEALLRHELAHVAQNQNAERSEGGASPQAELEREARAASEGRGAAVVGRAPSGAVLRDPEDDDEEAEEDDPFADWKPATGYAVVGTGDKVIVLPAEVLLYTPSKAALERYRSNPARMGQDAGALLGVPATGASGTRVVRAGNRTAIVIDAGSGTGVPSAMYLTQVQALFGRMGLSEVTQLRVIHIHTDHVNEIPTVVRGFGLAPENVHIPDQFLRGSVRRPLQGAINELRNSTDPAWQSWSPGTKVTNKSGASEWILTRYTQGDIRIEAVALTASLAAVNRTGTTAKEVDRASFLTKVTRVSDGASALILGDVRFSDMPLFERAMGTAKFNEFLKGVEILSGFSHHAGRFESGDIAGLQRVLDETMLKTGRLRVIEQTDPSGTRGQTRRDTIELMRQLGIELTYTERPAAGTAPSSAVASRDSTTTAGPAVQQPAPVNSPLTDALTRMQRLQQAGETIRNWRGLAESRGQSAAEIDRMLTEIDQSLATLRTSVRAAAGAAGRVRAEGTATAAGGRDYSASGGQHGTAFQTAIGAIPQTTAAETTIGADGFQSLSALRQRSTKDIPLQVAMELALRTGVYTDTAFRYMLSQIDPAARDSILYGKRGGPRPRRVAFQRLTAQFGFQQSVMPSGQISVAGFSRRGRMAARGVLGFMAFLELARVAGEVKQSIDLSHAANRRRNVAPFVRRLLFWNQLGIRPRIVGVDDDIGVDYEHDFDKVIEGLNGGEWDGLYIEHGESGPAISDSDIIVLGVMLAEHVRNIDEFDTLFLDSGQDAVTWETPEEGGWDQATWKVKVGHYETSGSNHVAERWEEIPKLTELMQVFSARIMANTAQLLALRGEGKAITEDTESGLGSFTWGLGKPAFKARLKNAAATSTVYVHTQGRNPRWLAREVTWWSPPEFYVDSDKGSDWTVSGADYNTFAILRRLKTENTQLYAGARANWQETDVVGNESGRVSIPAAELEKIEDKTPDQPLQRAVRAGRGAGVPPTAAVARAATDSSAGRPLPRSLAGEAERHFGLAAEGVRIHDDRQAHRLAAGIDALAFTRGEHIYFGAGEYSTSSASGRALLGHELAHVAQQRRTGTAARSSRAAVEPPGSAFEQEAGRAGERFAAGRAASSPVSVASQAAPAGIFRTEDTSTTADDLISRYTSWGNLDESGLGAKLMDLCWMSPAHYPLVGQVLDELWDFNEDDVARGFAAHTSEVVADQFAATEEGRKMLWSIIDELKDGFNWGEDARLAHHLFAAINRRAGADKGKERGLAVLDKAAASATPDTRVREADVLSIGELQDRMRLLGGILDRLEERYAKEPATLAALTTAKETLAAKRPTVSVDTAPELSLDVPDAQLIAERVEEVLLNLDLQLAGYRSDSAQAVTNEGMIAVTERIREGYVKALGLLLGRGAVAAFQQAEAVAAQLPRALTEAQLAQIESSRSGFDTTARTFDRMVEWIGLVRTELDQLEAQAQDLRLARERGASDIKEREERFDALRQKIELSLEGISETEKVVRAYQYLASNVNLVYTAYGSTGTLLDRVAAMRDAAFAGDLETLRARVEAYRNDPSIAAFYKRLPLFISASNFMVSLGITLVAAIASAGVGGAVAGSLGTAATTGGRILTFVGTAAVEAVTFTAVSRGLQSVAGQEPQGSALGELAWNFGLFLLLRGVGGGISKGLEARGLEILAKPLTFAASGGILQAYGVLRFTIEEGRWPTSDELSKMTAENLIMLLGITVATRGVSRALEAHQRYKTLQSFEHKYAWRFEALELGRQGLLNKFRTALESGQGADPKTLADLQETGKLIESEYRTLIEEIKADRSTPIEVAREELAALDFEPGAGSQELLTQSLGLPEEVRLRRAGGLDQYTYEWGQTGSLEDGLIEIGATVRKSAEPSTGLRTLSATFGDRAPLTFAERRSPFPARGEVDLDPSDAALGKLLTDFGITDPAAQRFVMRLLSIELAKNPANGTTSAAKPVRKQLKLYEAKATTDGKTTEQVVLEVRAQGLAGGKVDPAVKAAADALEVNGILTSPEWLAARDPGNFRGTVTEWLAVEDISSRQLPQEVLLRNVHFKGDLFTDSTLSTPLLDNQTGRPLRGVDAGSELDFLTVVETGGVLEFQTLYNAKGYASGGNAAAARQNAQALELLRAAESGKPAEITLNSGEKAFSQVKEIWAIDARTNAEVELTGRLEEAASGATQETIGLKQKGSTHTQQLPYDSKQIDKIVEVLRERFLMSSPDY